jgi:polyhydroxybutyrate depolymerase
LTALLLAGCHRKEKPPLRVHPVEGESAVLPRAVRAASAALTKASTRTIAVGGKQRRYTFVEPVTLDPEKRYPLVLVFHGDGGDAMGFHAAFPFERASGKEAFLAYPEGINSGWDLETTKDNREVRFVEAVIEEIAASQPIDRARIFATGYSSGGFLSNVLACHRPGLLRAIASNAGGAPYNQREKWENGYPKCPGQKPVAMLALHGEQDHGVTLDSGRFSAEYWAYVNGCKTDEMETTGYAECRVYRGCPAGKAVGFCSIPPLGHWVWSEAADASWTFFERQ